jgi:hypothetical protein
MSQYAIMPLTNGRKIMLDACELQLLDMSAAGSSLPGDKEPTEELCNAPASLVYGAFLPAPRLDGSEAMAREHIAGCEGHSLQVSLVGKVSFIGLAGITMGPTIRLGSTFRIPIAAYVSSSIPFRTDKRAFAITAYLAHGNLDQTENILNRYGIFALVTHERRFRPGSITAANWTEFVDDDRMIETASAVM